MPQSDFVNRGQELVAAGQFQEAVKVCRLGLLGRPAVAEGRVVLGRALRGLRRYDEVLAEMRVALDLDPTLVDAHVLKAEALLRTGEAHAAIEALQRARRLAPSDSRIAELLDEAEHSAGNRTASSGDDTVKRPAARADAAVPQPLEDATSDAIEVDPEVEGVEVRDDFDEMTSASHRRSEMAGDLPFKPAATMALPAPPSSAARRGSPTKPPPGAPAAAVQAEVKSPYLATLALPSALDAPSPSRGPGVTSDKPRPGLPGVAPQSTFPDGGMRTTLSGVRNDSAPQAARQAIAVQPTVAADVEPPMSTEQQQAAVNIARLFADPAPSRSAYSASPVVRSQPGALNMTLAGVGGPPLAPAVSNPPVPNPPRSRWRIVVWALIGAGLIGAGLVAGFQIRAMRLDKQIKAARERVREVTKSDSWTGWTSAADSLAAVANASATIENRAALARARSLIAFEFGDGQPAAERLVEELAGAGGLDGNIAAAYIALARGDATAAKQSSSAAVAQSSSDPAAMYVASQSALINGDLINAATLGKGALSKEARPQYALGLARVYAAASAWSDALNAVQRVLASEPDHPAAVLERGSLLAAGGRIAPGTASGKEIRAQIEKLLVQPRTLAPAQVAFGNLVLARIDFARNDVSSARSDVENAAKIGLDDQRFAEQAVETLYALGDLGLAQKTAAAALTSWPTSKRARLIVAEIALAQGRAKDALQLGRQADLAPLPRARALLGQARLAMDDLDGARKDFDAALKTAPLLEPALVGRAMLDLAANQVPGDAAKKLAERVASGTAVPSVAIAHAAVLRSSGELIQRDQARQLLETVIAGPPVPELVRAQLELARVYRDSGDVTGARKAYSDASTRGSLEARLEQGLLAIEDRDPKGGAAILNALLKDSQDSPRPALVVEVARARVLSGDHAGAGQLMEKVKGGGVDWKLNRERGRLLLRRGDIQGATTALADALQNCKGDVETFLLAADAAGAGATAEFSGVVDKLYRERLGESPQASLVAGKLLLAAGQTAKAEKAYVAARDAFKSTNGSPRLVAQANFGLAVIAYTRRNDPDALAKLNLVINDDPSLYDAYLFKADIIRDVTQALEQARAAIQYNPDYPRAWLVLGKAAASLGDRTTLADAVAKLKVIAPASPELSQLTALAGK